MRRATARAARRRDDFNGFYDQSDPKEAEPYVPRWCYGAKRSRLEPINVCRHGRGPWDGAIACPRNRLSNTAPTPPPRRQRTDGGGRRQRPPRRWGATAWTADVVPHLGYGAGTAAVLPGPRSIVRTLTGLGSAGSIPAADDPENGDVVGGYRPGQRLVDDGVARPLDRRPVVPPERPEQGR